MGQSGAGKSLLLRAIVDLDPSTGDAFIGNRERNDMPATQWRRLVSLVPADPGWCADRVGDDFPSKVEAEGLIEAMGLPGSFATRCTQDWRGLHLRSPPNSEGQWNLSTSVMFWQWRRRRWSDSSHS